MDFPLPKYAKLRSDRYEEANRVWRERTYSKQTENARPKVMTKKPVRAQVSTAKSHHLG